MNIDARSALKKFNLHPTKSLGQNFLNDGGVLKDIADAAQLTKNDIVLEIGPGLGSLTSELAEAAGMVIAVEIDKHLIPALNENLKAYSNVKIINGDIMRLNIEEVISDVRKSMRDDSDAPVSLKIVANLPYYITTPVIMMLLESRIEAETMVFMIQKEVADRMMAKPGGKDYGALSVAVQYYSKPSVIMEVPPHCFVPQPGVVSTVVRLDIYKTPPVELNDRELFFKVVKAAFGQRRKTLINALFNAGTFGQSKEQFKELLIKMGIGENQRGETLSIEQFAELSNMISKSV
jgi:16S rRNA (adenine1518-N6/adenine1519-N6)-dimethyltransferase